MKLFSPSGDLVQRVDGLTGERGAEQILAVATAGGAYRLRVYLAPDLEAGSFQARLVALRPAGPAEQRLAKTYGDLLAARKEKASPATVPAMQAAQTAFAELGDPLLAAEALHSRARAVRDLGELEAAADLFRAAAEAFAHQPGGGLFEEISRIHHGTILLNLGRTEEAEAALASGLAAARREQMPFDEARALLGLSQAKQRLGDFQGALDDGMQALALWPPENHEQRPKTLHSLGILHARRFHDREGGRRWLEEADAAYLPEAAERATTLSQLGRLAAEDGRLPAARQAFEKALELRDGKKDTCPSVVLLGRLAQVDFREDLPELADHHLAAARAFLEKQDCPLSRSTFEGLAGELALERGDLAAAKSSFGKAFRLFQELSDPLGQAESLAGLARAERALRRRDAALGAARQAIAILERVRPTILREDLRTSLFSPGRATFELAISLLLEGGQGEEAWAMAEQARARALRDLLEEGAAGAPGSEVAREERQLLRRLNQLESQLQAKEGRPELLRELRQQKAAVAARLESLRGERRRSDPRYARLAATVAPKLAEVRRELLEPGLTVLEYHLGEEGGALWVIGAGSLAVHPLPPRREIEVLAGQALAYLSSSEGSGTPPPLCRLAQILLAPAGPLGPRLVVVPDGKLAAFPWAALPDLAGGGECATAPPVVAGHQLSYLPSLETLVTQRRRLRGRPRAPGLAAIFADPLFGPDWPPLAESAAEADDLRALLPAGRILLAKGAAATRARALSPEVGEFRILHFATHGSLDAEQPLLSGLVLAQRDEQGREIDGLLRAYQIYGRDLAAELVVLAACETGLGQERAGEGLISGLPRAFLAAGARRVLVSLWPVGDRDSRALMAAFYRGLVGGLTPPEALRQAQLELWRAGRLPRAWAAFVLLGDFSSFELAS